MKRRRSQLTEFEQRVVLTVAGLREGEVVSYGDVAELAGRPRAARAVGRILSQGHAEIPWWRVLYSDGRLAECNLPEQRIRLEAEDVRLENNRVVQAPVGRFQG